MKMLRTHRINHLNHHLCSQKVNHSQASQFKLLILTFLESVPPSLGKLSQLEAWRIDED